MAKELVSGNQAIALGALNAGVKVISGYPGTPSSEVIGSIWGRDDLDGTHVEWSTNEKVAVEIGAAAAWAGQRSLCTMKMSGVNVAYDSLLGFAYSGVNGGLVIYVADDPGVTTGMCEQDTRGFALMSDMVILEPANVQECYEFTKLAFDLSEAIKAPVFVRGTTNTSQSYATLDYEGRVAPKEIAPILEKDISQYTKAGALICTNQHKALVASLAKAEAIIREKGYNKLILKGKLGVIGAGVAKTYITEALGIANRAGANIKEDDLSRLDLIATVPFAVAEIHAMLKHCDTIIVLEELEPHLEKEIYYQAYRLGVKVDIIGKNDGTFSRYGEYNGAIVAKGFAAAAGITLPETTPAKAAEAEAMAAARPITTCSGCPHRGTYISINQAIKNLKLKKDEVMVTGDIGCTILGMNPPFHTLWTEVSMGASIPVAQGYVHSGVKTPVIATIGDSTFFHGGIPGLINAIQQNLDLTVIIMDNGWTAMTGMQVNPGTDPAFQHLGCKQIDIVKVVEGLGVDFLQEVDPYDLTATTEAIQQAMQAKGVKVIVARRECAIQANRRKVEYKKVSVCEKNCTLCKVCINVTGCPAISLEETSIVIDPTQCNGCGICQQVCKFDAILAE